MKNLPPLRVALALLALFAGAALAQNEPPAPAPCSSPEHRAFGFWVGDWTVTQAGSPAGTNRVRWIDQGCAISESWTSASGDFTGHSLNFFDPATGDWHQVWVDSGGAILRLRGGLENGPELAEGAHLRVMVLRGVSRDAEGKAVRNRITWTPTNQDGVRQHWEISSDGESWETVFDGLYERSGSGGE